MPAPIDDLTFVAQADGVYAVQLGDLVIGYTARAPLNPAVWNACIDAGRAHVVAQRSTRQLAGKALASRLRRAQPITRKSNTA
ncbi:hypothetical protein K1T35_47575 (plasmid) [Pseudonocardia sp. DSM 110487]|uniref:hypothetical protein n=1 Tax=Pseudonocardia sp. DSM 110487 TaxID=2865833 RepID=UPI001C6A3422|nr:hypothetical protein [Pseudonocardia sp. DSM 110487]QYN41011.1 hypothetical protein K1T35_47575 [Pseudonocardia sp. DSM 110487]